MRLIGYDIENDPAESCNLAAARPDLIQEMRAAYDDWFDDVGTTRPDNYAPPRIIVGTPFENPVILNRNDWRAKNAPRAWAEPEHDGYWLIEIAQQGCYEITIDVWPLATPAEVRLTLCGQHHTLALQAGDKSITFENLLLPAGPARLDAQTISEGQVWGARFVRIRNPAIGMVDPTPQPHPQ